MVNIPFNASSSTAQQVYKEGRVRFEWLNHDFNKKLFRSECSLAVLPRPFKHLVVIVIKDISEQKEAEFRREEAMKKLQEVNAELGQFAYVVSHDLKAPLRSHLITLRVDQG